MIIRAISLWQPWGSLWLSERKLHETRHWPTKHRGWMAVHAAKRFERNVQPELREVLEDEFGGHWAMDLPTGALLGAVNIVDCQRSEDIYPDPAAPGLVDDVLCGDFTPGRFGWKRGQYLRLPKPIPYRGAQGIFTVTGEAADEIGDLIKAAGG